MELLLTERGKNKDRFRGGVDWEFGFGHVGHLIISEKRES